MLPTVSFIVPCYNYGCFLKECLESIFEQTYENFEVLVMDDCSSDETSDVISHIKDPRTRYYKHTRNLGHLENYNSGLRLSRGKYVWILSADDKLMDRSVLERYVCRLESDDDIGYAFCPAIGFGSDAEGGPLPWSCWPGRHDRVLLAGEILGRAASGCTVAAPTGLARRECYSATQGFPPELKRTGDWYLWARFSIEHKAAWFAKPMVGYRLHEASMEKTMARVNPDRFHDEELLTRWLLKEDCESAGLVDVVPAYHEQLAAAYFERIYHKAIAEWPQGRTWEQVKSDIRNRAASECEASAIETSIQKRLPTVAEAYIARAREAYRNNRTSEAVSAWAEAVKLRPSLKAGIILRMLQIEFHTGVPILSFIGKHVRIPDSIAN